VPSGAGRKGSVQLGETRRRKKKDAGLGLGQAGHADGTEEAQILHAEQGEGRTESRRVR
jgi:putative effector of murein hydrolase